MRAIQTEIWLLQIRNLIADKEMEISIANRELSKGDWLSDHELAIRNINKEIAHLEDLISKYAME